MFLLLECLLPLQLIKKLSDLFVSQSRYAEALELTKLSGPNLRSYSLLRLPRRSLKWRQSFRSKFNRNTNMLILYVVLSL